MSAEEIAQLEAIRAIPSPEWEQTPDPKEMQSQLEQLAADVQALKAK